MFGYKEARRQLSLADTKSDAERSRNMAAVRNANTRPETLLRRKVWRTGLRFFTSRGWKALTGMKLPGSPDLIFPRARVAVFVDGCFWHGCPLHYTAPEDNNEFWQRKLAQNLKRDREVDAALTEAGWRVVRIWEHELRKTELDKVVENLGRMVRSN